MRKRVLKSIVQIIPIFIVAGILSVISLYSDNHFIKELSDYSFLMVPPLLGGSIAKELSGSVGFIPGMILGYLSGVIGLGMFGGIFVGILLGYFINGLKKIEISIEMSSVMYIVLIPILSTLVVGLGMHYIFQEPMKYILDGLAQYLNSLDDKNNIFLNFVLGGLIGVDLGGPINKVAYVYATNTLVYNRGDVMGAIAVAISTPPLALGVSQFILKNRFSKTEREAGVISILLGILGITEGALLFLTRDITVLPTTVIGAAIGAAAATVLKVESMVPHGGMIILPLIDNKMGFLSALFIGVASTIFMLYFLKKGENNG
ncbi:PTS fructose transporter subunit IIC [uncultured Cetobacterium sp.]|uniref:PTS fructose transporter subunit IIC n=1 Tax=uncultured Cetobacterium sp. TaxID=527638 RepID=UPI0025EFDC8A|nr:PTS fructose transporter subunit IIC [uncultured Cetobacterium sp.]